MHTHTHTYTHARWAAKVKAPTALIIFSCMAPLATHPRGRVWDAQLAFSALKGQVELESLRVRWREVR